MGSAASLPPVTLVLPALNEERYLEGCVRSLLDDPYPRERIEILVVDGGSSDATREIASRLGAEFPGLRLIDNPARLQAPGVNLAVRAASPASRYIMRCDVHAEYAPGFLSRAVAAAERTGAALVGYGDAPRARGCFQEAVAFAQSHPIGVGGSWYRLGGQSRWVDHAKHGIFRRDAYEAAGGYDESFSHNEDSELSLRLIQSGERVWLDEGCTVFYYPRRTPAALARQYYLYGKGRAMTVLKHRLTPRPRQLAPALLVLGELASLPVMVVEPALGLVFAAYSAALLAVAAHGAVKTGRRCVLASALAFAIMHHAWGAGFIGRLLAGRGTVAGSGGSRLAPRGV